MTNEDLKAAQLLDLARRRAANRVRTLDKLDRLRMDAERALGDRGDAIIARIDAAARGIRND